MKDLCKPVMIMFFFGFCMLFIKTTYAGNVMPVYVSIVPQKYFVEKIGGALVNASVMVKPGANPATYEPKPRQMVDLSKTKIYFAIGVPFEKMWLKKIAGANPKILVVHTEKGIEKMPMKADNPQGIKDPHIWLSPPLVMIQARNILSALVVMDHANKSVYEGYFAGEYGLKQVPVEIEGKDPKPADLQRLVKYAKKLGVKVIFVQPQFSVTNASVIAQAIDGQLAFADPLALNWLDNLRQVAIKFKATLR